jgi:hypothetical protein
VTAFIAAGFRKFRPQEKPGMKQSMYAVTNTLRHDHDHAGYIDMIAEAAARCRKNPIF